MDIEKLIEQLRDKGCEDCPHRDTCRDDDTAECVIRLNAATALSTLQAENEKLRNEVERQRRSADDRKHLYENAERAYMKVVAELEQVKRERDAAVEDVAAIIGDVEEIRRGYGVDNADADGAFAELCETYCANNSRLCYAECEKYHCKNFKWRGQKEG